MLIYLRTIVRNFIGAMIAIWLLIKHRYHCSDRNTTSDDAITPLFFHRIGKRLFSKCVLWLKAQGYYFISTEQVINYIKGTASIPKKAVWITFDDGWEDNIENVIPIIIKYDIPVTFFISTDPVENGGVFWWSYVTRYGKYLTANKTIREMRKISEQQREQLIEQLECRFARLMPREAMTINEIRSIAKLPQVEIGCHTAHHVIMSQCNDQQLDAEIQTSKEKLERWINRPIKFFAYPEGDYNFHIREMIQKYGFEMAATTENRVVKRNENLFALPRFWVRGEGFFCEAKCQMLGIWVPFVMKIEKLFNAEFEWESLFGQVKAMFAEMLKLIFAGEIVWKSFIA